MSVGDPEAQPAADIPDVALHFQEWWTRYRAAIPARRFSMSVPTRRSRGPACWTVAAADLVLVAPSNPVVSVTPILTVPGVREALAASARSSAFLR
ncbi:MAG: 2-phospho-L-lactate transferase CofD family protein [Nakamurella sp.]